MSPGSIIIPMEQTEIWLSDSRTKCWTDFYFEEGGITSHAAVVGILWHLGILVFVGVENGTKLIKDLGQEITVNAQS